MLDPIVLTRFVTAITTPTREIQKPLDFSQRQLHQPQIKRHLFPTIHFTLRIYCVFTASLSSLLGAEYEPDLQTFTVDVTVGNFTSSDLVGSTRV